MAYGPHVMTPARRAALRKAQLASAAKRRKYGTVTGSAKRAIRQKAGYAGASFAVARHTGTKGHFAKTKKAAKYTAIAGAGAVALGAAAAASRPMKASYSPTAPQAPIKVSSVRIRNGAPAMKALPSGAFTPRAKY